MPINTTHFKQKLEEELALIEKELKTVAHKNPKTPGDWEVSAPEMGQLGADPMDEASAYEAEEGNAGILNELEIRYNELKDALKRIEDGAYGVCAVGGEEIEEERLEANPAATTCMKHLP